jgi:hypothetical protein
MEPQSGPKWDPKKGAKKGTHFVENVALARATATFLETCLGEEREAR